MKKSASVETFAACVKRLRTEKEFSLVDVERNSGGRITNGYVSRVENGHETNLQRDKVIALADGLRVPLSALVSAFFETEVVKPENAIEEEITLCIRKSTPEVQRFLLICARALSHSTIQAATTYTVGISTDQLPAEHVTERRKRTG